MGLGFRKILSVVGARPNFMKLAPLARALTTRPGVSHYIVHTGQHYDQNMSDLFFADLGIPEPDCNLEVGSGSHAQQTGAIMQRFEPVCIDVRPDLVLVYGDVNSTVAAALVASKLGIKVGHVEAGLRSGDWEMPEEVNRVLTDRLSDVLLVPSEDGLANLAAEGIPAERTHLVGNIMIDSLVWALPKARSLDAQTRYGVADRDFVLVTLHRPSNVDDPEILNDLLRGLADIAKETPVLFPVHPRTRDRMDRLGWTHNGSSMRLEGPVGYHEMLALTAAARCVVTDSGGVQEETTYLGVPCLTVRRNTERPITCERGTNRLVAPTYDAIVSAAGDVLGSGVPDRPTIEMWDGRTAERIADLLC